MSAQTYSSAAEKQKAYRMRKATEQGKTYTPSPCAPCRNEKFIGHVPHSCENFPLPSWAGDYLAAFDRRDDAAMGRIMAQVR